MIQFPDDPKTQIIELGKQYVKFLVENPEYLKFLSSHLQQKNPVFLDQNQIQHSDPGVFEIFNQSAIRYLNSINAKVEDRMIDILTMWSVVHGFAVLLIHKSIVYPGDYLELIGSILRDKLKF